VSHLLLGFPVGVDGKGEPALGAQQPPGAMQKTQADRTETQETPTSWALSAGSSFWWVCNHLKFPG